MNKIYKVLQETIVLILIVCISLAIYKLEDNSRRAEVPTNEVEQYLLPHDLRFGDSYETCVEKNPNMPRMESADSNSGYFCGGEYVEEDFLQAFFGVSVNVDTNAIMLSYSLNQNEELYEVYVITSLPKERDGENAFNEMAEYYAEKLETEMEFSESAEALEANLKTERFSVTVSLSPRDEEGFMLCSVVHDFSNDLE